MIFNFDLFILSADFTVHLFLSLPAIKLLVPTVHRGSQWRRTDPNQTWRAVGRCPFIIIMIKIQTSVVKYSLPESKRNGNHLLSDVLPLVCSEITFEFSLNVFTEFNEFSDKIFVITVRRLEPATQPPLVLETRMPPQHQQDTCERQDL